ncbi:MAG: hypothetical protein KGN76_02515 [Acidobacteriota bacterium]|nr:hypothetical protein [Acidobacteriota bacterium]
MPGRWGILAGLVLATALGGQAAAQAPLAPPPARVAGITGRATLERVGRVVPVRLDLSVMPGDRLRTTDGRLELWLIDGSVLDIDTHTTVDLLDLSLLRLLNGRIRLTSTVGPDGMAPPLRIDAPGGIVQTGGPGVYDVQAADERAVQLTLAVVRGSATLSTDHASLLVGPGQWSVARDNGVPAAPAIFNVARLDPFANWADAQQEALAGSRAASDLPPGFDVSGGAIDQTGTWQTLSPYGEVGYPQGSAGWQPDADGQWQALAPYGWIWIPGNRWRPTREAHDGRHEGRDDRHTRRPRGDRAARAGRTFLGRGNAAAAVSTPGGTPITVIPMPSPSVALPRNPVTSAAPVDLPPPFTGPYRTWTSSPSVTAGTSDTGVSKFPSRTLGSAGPGLHTVLPSPSPSGPAAGRIIGSPWSSYRTMSSARDSAGQRHETGWTGLRFVAPAIPSATALPRVTAPRVPTVPGTAGGMREVVPLRGVPTAVAPIPGGMKAILPVTAGVAAPAAGTTGTTVAPAAAGGTAGRHPAGPPQAHGRIPRRP